MSTPGNIGNNGNIERVSDCNFSNILMSPIVTGDRSEGNKGDNGVARMLPSLPMLPVNEWWRRTRSSNLSAGGFNLQESLSTRTATVLTAVFLTG
jgi:hypothetical protein